jgi:hypothetical protein
MKSGGFHSERWAAFADFSQRTRKNTKNYFWNFAYDILTLQGAQAAPFQWLTPQYNAGQFVGALVGAPFRQK